MATLAQLNQQLAAIGVVIEIEKLWTKNGYTAWYGHILQWVNETTLKPVDYKCYSQGETPQSQAWWDSVEHP